MTKYLIDTDTNTLVIINDVDTFTYPIESINHALIKGVNGRYENHNKAKILIDAIIDLSQNP